MVPVLLAPPPCPKAGATPAASSTKMRTPIMGSFISTSLPKHAAPGAPRRQRQRARGIARSSTHAADLYRAQMAITIRPDRDEKYSLSGIYRAPVARY
jgi:hypothetical protein